MWPAAAPWKNFELARVTLDDDIEDDGEDLADLLGESHALAPSEATHVTAPSAEAQAAEIEWLAAFNELTPKHAVFVTEYASGITATEAARRAGYPSASARAHKLLTQCKPVMRAIDAWCERQRTRGAYTAERAMVEAERGMVLAEKGNQMNAFVRAVELRARLNGLLVDKLEATVDAGPNVTQALILNARLRAERVRPAIVDAQFEEVRNDDPSV